MIVNNNEPNFTFITSSFTANEDSVGNQINDSVVFNTGACLSNFGGASVVLSGVFGFETDDKKKHFLAGEADDKFYLGISSDLARKDSPLTELGLFSSEKREEKNTENESFWTWLELFNNKKHIGLETDIVFSEEPVDLGQDNYGSFEEYAEDTIFRLSYSETESPDSNFSKVFKKQRGELVLFSEDPKRGQGKTQYNLVNLDSYETSERRREMGIINFDKKSIINLNILT